MNNLISKLDARAKKGIHQRLAVMMVQLGYIAHGFVYGEHASDKKDARGSAAYFAESRLALADLITQCRVLAEERGWKWDELVADGEERFLERMDELKRGII